MQELLQRVCLTKTFLAPILAGSSKRELSLEKIGMRVGAIQSMDEKQVHLFGFGVYEGDKVPPKELFGFDLGFPNPQIKLDNGKLVFGFECWWGSEEQMRAKIAGREVIEVDIEAARRGE